MVFIIKIMASIIYNILCCIYVILSLLLLSLIHCTHKFLGTFCTLAMWNKHKQYEHNKNHELCSS